jgi:hypothetical protein
LSFDLKDYYFMKRIKIVLTSLTLALALTGVVVAKANEKKRFNQLAAFFQKSGGGWGELDGDAAYFSTSVSHAAIINDDGNNPIQLYATAATSTPISFNP